MRCTTQHGSFQCDRELDSEGKHDGECETNPPASGPLTTEARLRVLEQQVASLQLAMPRGIPR